VGLGLAIWIVVAVGAVGVRGVRWDEAYEHAQILSGRVPYPAGHPLYRYVHNGFSLQTYLSAAVVWIAPGPVVLCGIRNVLFVLTTVAPVYLFAGRLAGDAMWGHAAAALALSGILVEFDGSYPLSVWPNTFTNGYLGGGYMLVTLFLILSGRLRTGLFLLGLAPAIHVGELPAILGVSGLFLVWKLIRGGRAEVIRAAPWGLAGLALCVAFAGIMRLFHVPIAGAPADASEVMSVWRGYTEFFDPHRRFPSGNAQIAAVGALLLGGAAARSMGRTEPMWRWLWIYIASVSLMVWGVMAVHAAMDREIPFLLIGWMPYRLLNLALPVLLATIAGVLAAPDPRGDRANTIGPWMVCGALAFAFALPVVRALIGEAAVDRYFSSGEFLLMLLAGSAYARLARGLAPDRLFFAVWQLGVAGGFVALTAFHQLGAAAFALGAGCTALAESGRGFTPAPLARWATPLTAGLLAAALLWGEFGHRAPLPRSDFDRRAAAYLDGRGQANAVLLARPDEFLLQARTGHPVLVETATASLMSYQPELGPGIQRTYQDIYGIRFDRAPEGDVSERDWEELWSARTAGEWHALASGYGFDYIVAPARLELKLEEVLRGDGSVMYRADGAAGPDADAGNVVNGGRDTQGDTGI
jgi:hypothetical protein